MTNPNQPSPTKTLSTSFASVPESSSELTAPRDTIPSGIAPLDAREGGLLRGGSYLIVGPPGPPKMVAALQFLHRGLTEGERALLVTNADAAGILDVARAWGFDMEDAWREGTLQIVGFRDDFELRAIRSIAPEEVIEELQEIIDPSISRVAVDPGTMFLTGGAKTRLGAAFVRWASTHPGTVVSTFSVDGPAASLPSSADWLVLGTTARLLLEPAERGLLHLTIARPFPDPVRGDGAITLELKPGKGLVEPVPSPERRGADRRVDADKLLVVSLDGSQADDLEAWAAGNFDASFADEPFDAVNRLQSGVNYGAVLVHASRRQLRGAVQACRAIRPLTRAAIVFASDDAIRSTDRIQLLEAGADDCLSGGLDFRELGLRIRQSIAAGAKSAPEVTAVTTEAPSPPTSFTSDGKSVSSSVFADQVESRGADAGLSFFCVVHVTAGSFDPTVLEEALVSHVRHEEGDLVSLCAHGCVVLLQGTRAPQVGPFLARLWARLGETAAGDPYGLGIEVLSHPADRTRIEALLRTCSGSED